MFKITKWVRRNRWESLGLVFIIILAFFFRFYKLEETFYFISDTGRDAQAAFKILVDHKLTLLGPRASVAGFYLGPFYFYLITIPLLLFNFDPLGLAYFSAAAGVFGVILIYLIARNLFNLFVAFSVAFLFAVSNIVITHTRMAWNPTLVPVFSLLLILFLIYYVKSKKTRWSFLIWITLGLGIQLHFNFLYLIPPVVLIFLLHLRTIKNRLREILIGFSIIFFLNSSLLIFDLRHNFITGKAFIEFILNGGENVSLSFSGLLNNFWQHQVQIFDLTLFPGFFKTWKVLLISIFIFGIILKENKKNIYRYIFILFFISVILFSFFRGTIQLYYYNFLLPFPFLFLGYAFYLFRNYQISKLVILIFLAVYFWQNFNLNINPSRPPRTLAYVKEVTKIIVDNIPPNTPYNLAAFSKEPWYTAEEYRYFTYYFGNRSLDSDEYDKAQILYIISSKELENPLAIQSKETSDFKAKIIEKDWLIGETRIFQLGR